MVSLMQNEGKTDNKKTIIMVSFEDDFSAPSKREWQEGMFSFWLFHQFTTQLYTYDS